MQGDHFAKGNVARVFRHVYEHRRVSKQQVAHDLGMSLPTVSRALAKLAGEGIIKKSGTFPSAGGRPAVMYEFYPDARFAIGVELVAKRIDVAFIDLYGHILSRHTHHIGFERSKTYDKCVSVFLEEDMAQLSLPHERLLGATIAIKGIVSKDRVTFGGLLGANSAKISLEDFARHISFPLRLVHDAEAAAYAEAWRHGGLQDFAYLSLNDHLGSALIRNRELVRSDNVGAGVAEHMIAIPQGKQCYCGNHGCFETVLGAKALERHALTPIPEFFESLRAGDSNALRVWDIYLEYLALLIHNLRMAACGNVVIGGRLARYLTQKDLRTLRIKCTSKGVLSARPFHLVRGQYEDLATVIGAGVMTINEFLMSV